MNKNKYPNYINTKNSVSYDLLYDWLHNKEYTYKDIENIFEYSERLISKLAKEYNIPKNFKSIAKNCNTNKAINFNYDEIYRMYIIEYMSLREIAKIIGCTHSSVSKFLKEKGIKIRPANEKKYYDNRKVYYSKSKKIDSLGYRHVTFNSQNLREHRYIMEKYLNRKLSKKEYVHHIDFNKNNNDISNLYLFENGTLHACYHQYINRNNYIHPSEYVKKYRDYIMEYISYDFLNNQYIKENKSANEISKEINNLISRQAIVKHLKKLGIYELREPTIN